MTRQVQRKSQQTKVRLVLAGPGAGKTTSLVNEVAVKLPKLSSHKQLVIITYTNAATDKLSKALASEIQNYPNVFIGTIHRFLNEFVVQPYSQLFGLVGGDELVFLEGIELSKPAGKPNDKAVAEKVGRSVGLIPYSQIEWIAKKLICDSVYDISRKKKLPLNPNGLSTLVANRIQYMFIDEYQDATLLQNAVFKKLISTDSMEEIYLVGDPEQYIYGFTYTGSRKKPVYGEIPINSLQHEPNTVLEQNTNNYRSTAEIVRFLNHFSARKQSLPSKVGDKVEFLDGTNAISLLGRYEDLTQTYNVRFVLVSSLNNLPDEVLDSGKVIGNNVLVQGPISTVSSIVTGALRMGINEIRAKLSFTDLEYRLMCLDVYVEVTSQKISSEDELLSFLKKTYKVEPTSASAIKSKPIAISSLVQGQDSKDNKSLRFATIHKSKGLEADSVLVIAKNNNELLSWIESDQSKRLSSNVDDCRVGYVAFSRAKRLLYLSCLEPLNENIEQQLVGLGVKLDKAGQHEDVGSDQLKFSFI